MPTYEHKCDSCNHEWEDYYSITAEPPTICPECNEATAKRLCSGGSGKGMVELYGQDLVDKIKSDTKSLKKDMHAKEKVYANMLGEDNYQKLQTQIDNSKK